MILLFDRIASSLEIIRMTAKQINSAVTFDWGFIHCHFWHWFYKTKIKLSSCRWIHIQQVLLLLLLLPRHCDISRPNVCRIPFPFLEMMTRHLPNNYCAWQIIIIWGQLLLTTWRWCQDDDVWWEKFKFQNSGFLTKLYHLTYAKSELAWRVSIQSFALFKVTFLCFSALTGWRLRRYQKESRNCQKTGI